MRITFHVGPFTVTITVQRTKRKNRHSAKWRFFVKYFAKTPYKANRLSQYLFIFIIAKGGAAVKCLLDTLWL